MDSESRMWLSVDISDDEECLHPNVYPSSFHQWKKSSKSGKVRVEKQRKSELEERVNADSCLVGPSVEKKVCQPCLEARESSKRRTEIHKNKVEGANEAVTTLPKVLNDVIDVKISRTFIKKKLYRRSTEKIPHMELVTDKKIFLEQNEETIKELGWLFRLADTKALLENHPQLLCKATVEELSRICASLAVQEKVHAMRHVAGQCTLLLYINQMARATRVSPLMCLSVVSNRLKFATSEMGGSSFEDHDIARLLHSPRAISDADAYYQQYCDDVERFVWFISEHATKHMKDQATEEPLELELDPVEVLETLPAALREGFREHNVLIIQDCLSRLTEKDAKHHMERSVRSGLWKPNSQDKTIDQKTGLKTIVKFKTKQPAE